MAAVLVDSTADDPKLAAHTRSTALGVTVNTGTSTTVGENQLVGKPSQSTTALAGVRDGSHLKHNAEKSMGPSRACNRVEQMEEADRAEQSRAD